MRVDAPQEKARPAPRPVSHASVRARAVRRAAQAPRAPAQPIAVAPRVEKTFRDSTTASGVVFGRGPIGVQGYVAAGTSSATKTTTSIMDIPQSVTILTKQQMQDRGSVSLGQALTYVPGVTVAQGEGNRDQITIRGQDTTADFYTDGVRDDAQYYRDLYNISSVEVLKGPSAMIFGRGGGGGVVNRVTKKADGQTIRELGFSTGSWGRKRATVDLGQAVSDTVALRLNALYEQSYGFRDFFDLERYGVNPTLTWRPEENTYLTLNYEHFRDHRTADRGIPSIGGVSVGGLPVVPAYPASVPIDSFFGNPGVSYSKVDLNRASLVVDHKTDFGLEIHNQTVYADYQKRYQNTFPDQPVNLATGLVRIDGYVASNPRQSIFNQTDFTYKFSLSPDIRHTLLFGAEFGNQRSDDWRDLSRWNDPLVGPQRVTTPFWSPTVYNQVSFTNPNRRRHTDLDLAAGYVQDQIEITRYVNVVAGVRFDSFDLAFADALTGQQLKRADNRWSPRVGVVVKPLEELSLYGSWSRSFLPSAGDQFNVLNVTTASLAPQRFENFEIGFKAQILPLLYFTGALYQLDRTNQQLTVGPIANIIGDTRTRGGEVGLVGKVTDEWQVSLGYAHQAAAIMSAENAGAVGRVVPSVPRDTFSFWNRYDITPMFGVGAGVVHNARFYAAIDNSVIVPGYTRVDGAVFFNPGKDFFGLGEEMSAQVNIENILGATYYAAAHNNNNIMPGAPRSAYVTINAKF
ncbi:TonB-dependent siderophore receptor [Methylosinus sp. H3A]|uniref:TonB-dependent receptor n=1 Tax=Methylosinus sp. H3A TaxID=2785786 RepID=UPI002897C38E|nr:TonB-dependent siderophore receptor [Methylosinus sp. H3A]